MNAKYRGEEVNIYVATVSNTVTAAIPITVTVTVTVTDAHKYLRHTSTANNRCRAAVRSRFPIRLGRLTGRAGSGLISDDYGGGSCLKYVAQTTAKTARIRQNTPERGWQRFGNRNRGVGDECKVPGRGSKYIRRGHVILTLGNGDTHIQ